MVESQDILTSVQGTKGLLSFPSGTTKHVHIVSVSQQSLSVSRGLAHLLSNQLCISAQVTLGHSSYSQQLLQHSESSKELLGPSKSDQGTHRYFSSVPDALRMSPCVPINTVTLTHVPMTSGHSSLTRACPIPSPFLQRDDGYCLYTQTTMKMNTSGQGSLNPSPSSQVPGKASLYAITMLGQPISAKSSEGHPASTSETL